VVCAPGNPGIAAQAEVHAVPVDDLDGLVALATACGADLAVIGPEAPLVAGLADRLRAAGVPTVGPSADAARLEGSKAFAKEIMVAAGVPTAASETVTDVDVGLFAADDFG
jgi:phosphoribosylamine---glycine ligase